MIRVGVLGARGRMGSAVVSAVTQDPDMELVAALDVDDPLAQLVESGASVVVDFTNPAAVMANIEFALAHGISVVVGTSGLVDEQFEAIRSWLRDGDGLSVIVAPNFGIAAVLMMQFAAKAAPHFDSVEIVELHHPDKVDAPSGTARRTAQMIGDARARVGVGPMPDATRDGDFAPRGEVINTVPVHSVRLRGLVAHQEVILGTSGEVLTIRHDSMNRESFMPGVLLAVRRIHEYPGLTVGLEHLLEL